MIHVVAIITAKPGLRESILTHFHANVPAELAEQGCIEYGPVVDADPASTVQTKAGADTFIVIEKWSDMAALQVHAAAPHMAAYAVGVKDMIASRIVHVLAPA